MLRLDRVFSPIFGTLLTLVVPGVPLNDCEDALYILCLKYEGGVANLDIVGETSQILLLVVFPNGKLVVDQVVALNSDGGEVCTVVLLELLELLHKNLLE